MKWQWQLEEELVSPHLHLCSNLAGTVQVQSVFKTRPYCQNQIAGFANSAKSYCYFFSFGTDIYYQMAAHDLE